MWQLGRLLLAAAIEPQIESEACQSVSVFPFNAGRDPRSGDAVHPVSAVAAQRGGFAVRAATIFAMREVSNGTVRPMGQVIAAGDEPQIESAATQPIPSF